jgi:hypothetical protein
VTSLWGKAPAARHGCRVPEPGNAFAMPRRLGGCRLPVCGSESTPDGVATRLRVATVVHTGLTGLDLETGQCRYRSWTFVNVERPLTFSRPG